MSRLVHRRLFLQHAALAVLCVLLCPPSASAVHPPSKSDDDLAKEPIVVIARWNKEAPWKGHELVEDNAVTAYEIHTELVVERVLRGDVKAGKHKLLVSYPIAWDDKGGPLVAYSS